MMIRRGLGAVDAPAASPSAGKSTGGKAVRGERNVRPNDGWSIGAFNRDFHF
jgi:hypothetical protein